MSSAVIYARISKDEAGESLGVERQERLCRKLATERGLTVVDVLIDNDVSAYRTKARPQFERLVELLDDGHAGAVITYHADRLYRRTTDLERLVELVETSGAHVHTVAAGDVDLGTASGRMVARMLGAAAQHESERMGERIKMKHDELAASGRPPGGRPPFGYAWGHVPGAPGELRRTYVVNPAEAAALRTMARRVLEGASLLAISRELDAAGITTREGRPWHHSSVRTALLNPAIAALRVHRREVAGPGEWEPVLDRPTWEEVRAVLADPSRKRTRPARSYLLAGYVESPDGDRMNGRPDRGAGGEPRRTYATRAPAVRSLTVGADELEDFITAAIFTVTDAATLPAAETPTTAGTDVTTLEAELAELAGLRGAGTISLAEWLAARAPLQERLEGARRAAGTTRRPPKAAKLLAQPGAVRKAWDGLDLTGRRAILGELIERVIVGPASRGRWTNLDERLDPDHGYGIQWKA